MPASIAACTNSLPGSEIDGIPASLTWAIVTPFCSFASSSGMRIWVLCSWNEIVLVAISKWFNNIWVCRVSSAAIRSTVFKSSTARIVMSAKLPIGVGTKYNVPVVWVPKLRCCSKSILPINNIKTKRTWLVIDPALAIKHWANMETFIIEAF